jgi:hypothetical protein
MSHFTHIKTCFQNLFYLEKVLSKLNIVHEHEQTAIQNSTSSHINLVVPQSNGYDVEFCWDGQEYEVVVDLHFWKQSYSINCFIDRIAQKYAGEVVIGESRKIGFQPVKYQQNSDGSNTLVLERWSSTN